MLLYRIAVVNLVHGAGIIHTNVHWELLPKPSIER